MEHRPDSSENRKRLPERNPIASAWGLRAGSTRAMTV